MNRFFFAQGLPLILLFALRSPAPTANAAEPNKAAAWVTAYNVVWHSPGTRGHDSMPVSGGGNLALNVWAERDAVLIYLGSPDTWNDAQLLSKMGRLRVVLSPNPWGKNFRQKFDAATGSVRLRGEAEDGTRVKLRVWVDAHQPVVHLDGNASGPVTVTASLETIPSFEITGGFAGDAIEWRHRNQPVSEARLANIKGWKLEPIADLVPDPLSNLTYGGRLSGEGMTPDGTDTGAQEGVAFRSWKIKTITPTSKVDLRATLRIAQDPTLEQWQSEVARLAEATRGTAAADWDRTAAWWGKFWGRSRIVINPDAKDADDPAWQVGRNYQLFRAMLASNRTGRFPTLFNGGAFTCEASPSNGGWEDCRFMAQNQRLVYWPMLAAGDNDLLKVGLDFYANTAALQAARIKQWLGVDGVIYDESLNTMGLGNFPSDDGLDGYPHLRHHFTSGMEFALMMLESARYSGADVRPYLPVIEGAIVFFDQYYRRQNQARTGNELDENGRLVIFPGSGLELYGNTRNATDALSALMALSDGLLALPEGVLTAERRAYVQGFRDRLAPLPTRMMRDHLTLSPAESWEHEGDQENMEFPALYAVFPFRVFGMGKPGLELARDTWWHGDKSPFQKRDYCWYQGNIFTAALGLTAEAKEYALAKFLFPSWPDRSAVSATRFPAFWHPPLMADGAKFCQEPDMDHGGSAMVGLQEMALQTDGRKILLLPAWPKEWDVDFKLHAPLQTTVKCRFRHGKVEKLVVVPAWRAADVVDMSGIAPPLPHPLE